jgi:PiT family inorganic phosphate transporter
MDNGQLFIVFACVLGLFMTWGVGANDLANVMSTSIGSRAISTRQALIIGVVFELAGALLGGDEVMDTIRRGIINTEVFNPAPHVIIYGMLAVLLAGASWMLTASYFGLPVSITNAIVGSIVGFGAIVLGTDAIHWQRVGCIAISWVASPALAGIAAYLLFISIQRLILASATPYQNAKRYIPYYLFLVGTILSSITIINALQHLGIVFHTIVRIGIALGFGFTTMLIGSYFLRRYRLHANAQQRTQFTFVEKMFGNLMAFTACAMVFAHGSNDVPIAVGPIAAVLNIVGHAGQMATDEPLPQWLLILGCFGVIVGLLTYGRRVIATVGSNITSLTPSRAFAATLAAATTVVVSTSFGIPVSATQTLVGGVLGVGLARGIGALNLRVIRNIFMSWVITLPAACLLTILYFYLFQWLFNHL